MPDRDQEIEGALQLIATTRESDGSQYVECDILEDLSDEMRHYVREHTELYALTEDGTVYNILVKPGLTQVAEAAVERRKGATVAALTDQLAPVVGAELVDVAKTANDDVVHMGVPGVREAFTDFGQEGGVTGPATKGHELGSDY